MGKLLIFLVLPSSVTAQIVTGIVSVDLKTVLVTEMCGRCEGLCVEIDEKDNLTTQT